MLIASCVASVGPSVIAPLAIPDTAVVAMPGCMPDSINNFSTISVLAAGPNFATIPAGRIESNAAAKEPANAAAPGAISPVSSYTF